MKKGLRFISLLLCLLLTASVLLTACGEDTHDHTDDTQDTQNTTDTTADTEKPNTESNDDAPDYSGLDLDKYIKLSKYKGLVIDARGKSESTELWNAIIAKCEVIEYPAGALSYYVGQTQKKYESIAKDTNMSYDELIKVLDLKESDFEKEAKDLIKKDLAMLAILKAEGIELTDKEKKDLFDKYAQVYIDLYDYSYNYVRDNLADEVYESMLYDKMMEYLIKENFFIAED